MNVETLQTPWYPYGYKLHGVCRHSIICACRDPTWDIHLYEVSIYMECGATPHSIISIWIEIWICIWSADIHGVWRHSIICTCGDTYMNHTSIWSVNLHGVWRHSTLCNIHIYTNMNMKHESTWSVNIHGVWRHSTLHNIHMDANMDMDTEHESTCSVFWIYNCSSSQWDQFKLKIWCVHVFFQHLY